MLDKIVKRTIRRAGAGKVLTIPCESGFEIDDTVLVEQINENTLVIRKAMVTVKGIEKVE